MRGLAAFYVVLHHMCLEIWPIWGPASGLTAKVTAWFMWGHFAVAVFIVISGYCLALPVIRGRFTPLQFYWRRAKRILPPYYIGVAFSSLLILSFIGTKTGTHWDTVLPISWRALMGMVLLYPEFAGKINHSYWSIGIECKIYVLLPLIVWLFGRIGVLTTLALTSLLAFGMAHTFASPTVAKALIHFLGLFCFGMFAAYVVHGRERLWTTLRGLKIWTLLFVCAGAATVSACWYWGYPVHHNIAVDCAVGLSAVGLFVAAGKSDGLLCRCLSWKPLVSLGAISYSLYLIHAPLIQLFWQYGIDPFDLAPQLQFIALLLTMPLILLCAWVFYRLCERPFIPRQT